MCLRLRPEPNDDPAILGTALSRVVRPSGTVLPVANHIHYKQAVRPQPLRRTPRTWRLPRGAPLRPSTSCDAAPRTSALPPTYRRSTIVVRLCTFEIKEAEDLIKHHEAGPA